MVTGPAFELVGGSPALDLVNSIDRTLGKPWIERLTSYADLLAWSAAGGTLPRERLRRLAREAEARPREAAAVLERVRALREAAYRVLSGRVEGQAPAHADLDALDAELGAALSRTRLERRPEGFAWAWDPDPTALDAPLWPVVRALGELLVSPELEHVKRCASSTCLWLFLDATKNHQRRWCDMKVCGNRAKVRAHRKRERTKRRGGFARGVRGR
jgi:predicted RNA-binding Zn ribbon-like protein